jgi:hypothetical protein
MAPPPYADPSTENKNRSGFQNKNLHKKIKGKNNKNYERGTLEN